MEKMTKNMKDLREDRDLKQEAVAISLKITRQQYQLYESGKRKIPIDKFKELCQMYDISADYLLGFTEERKPLPRR